MEVIQPGLLDTTYVKVKNQIRKFTKFTQKSSTIPLDNIEFLEKKKTT